MRMWYYPLSTMTDWRGNQSFKNKRTHDNSPFQQQEKSDEVHCQYNISFYLKIPIYLDIPNQIHCTTIVTKM